MDLNDLSNKNQWYKIRYATLQIQLGQPEPNIDQTNM